MSARAAADELEFAILDQLDQHPPAEYVDELGQFINRLRVGRFNQLVSGISTIEKNCLTCVNRVA